jgi:hypothetical protein
MAGDVNFPNGVGRTTTGDLVGNDAPVEPGLPFHPLNPVPEAYRELAKFVSEIRDEISNIKRALNDKNDLFLGSGVPYAQRQENKKLAKHAVGELVEALHIFGARLTGEHEALTKAPIAVGGGEIRPLYGVVLLEALQQAQRQIAAEIDQIKADLANKKNEFTVSQQGQLKKVMGELTDALGSVNAIVNHKAFDPFRQPAA